RATARDRPYYTRACQADSLYSRVDPCGQPWEVGLKLVRMGDPLRSPWPLKLTLMRIAPTILRLAFHREVALGAASCRVGAIPCGRPGKGSKPLTLTLIGRSLAVALAEGPKFAPMTIKIVLLRRRHCCVAPPP